MLLASNKAKLEEESSKELAGDLNSSLLLRLLVKKSLEKSRRDEKLSNLWTRAPILVEGADRLVPVGYSDDNQKWLKPSIKPTSTPSKKSHVSLKQDLLSGGSDGNSDDEGTAGHRDIK